VFRKSIELESLEHIKCIVLVKFLCACDVEHSHNIEIIGPEISVKCSWDDQEGDCVRIYIMMDSKESV